MKRLIGPLAGLLLAVCAPLAHADLQITFQIDGNAAITCGPVPTPGPGVTSLTCANVTQSGVTISVLSASSNSPSTSSTTARETSSTVDISSVAGVTVPIKITVSATGYTSPTTPPNLILLSHIGGTVLVGSGANVVNYQSCVDATNTLASALSAGGAVCPVGGSFPSGVSAPAITAVGSFQDDKSSTITSLGSPYAIDESYNIALGAGSDINFSASSTLTSVPEPMSITLLGGALLAVTSLARRKASKASQA